ncbi:sensor histidine kinase [Chitinophaga barathri]|uniref:histidine kinase n=1 Tax=Chitinophaga barathri TaxID=1647451 RepID=A0A3N4MJ70_9BACT|nr:sensor histidine kinase [Chitinophaga barathri]RPD42106.1 hypothetical protein EG028_08150 [Chitinophaga barathri]
MRSFVLLLGLISRAFSVQAADIDTLPYTVENFTDENGLPQNSVKSIAPDNDGFLWLATENGLVRFDGQKFRNFNGNDLPLRTSRMTYIYPDAGRKMLFARTSEKEVIRISNGRATFWHNHLPVTRDYEYFVYNDTTGIYPVVGLPNGFKSVMRVDHYLIPTGARSYYLISRNSYSYMDKDRKLFSHPFAHNNPWNFFTIRRHLYFLDAEGKFLMLDNLGGHPVNLCGDITENPAYNTDKNKMELYWNYVADQLFIYLNGSLYRLTEGEGGMLYTQLVLQDFEFHRQDIISVYQDEQHHRLFLGSFTKGLFVITKKQFRPRRAGLGSNEVYYSQNVYGTNGVITPQGFLFDETGKTYEIPLLRQQHVGDAYSMQTDQQGNHWHKSNSHLLKYNKDFTELLWVRELHDEINRIYAGQDGRLWIGFKHAGLYYVDTDRPDPVPLLFTSAVQDITYFSYEHPGVLWVGSGRGLFKVKLSNAKVDTIAGLSGYNVRSVYSLSRKELWVTTYDKGFFLLENGMTYQMPLDRLQYLNTAHCITQDDNGYFWITTNKGLFQVARKDLLAYAHGESSYVFYLYYGKNKGFNTNEFNGGCQPCALKLPNGNLSLPSLDGLVMFPPSGIKAELPDKGLFIDNMEMDTRRLALTDTVVLPNNYQQFRLEVSTPYFGDRYNVQLFYTLEGDGEDIWLPVENDRSISFSRLHSGNYRLRVRKVNGFGRQNYIDKVVFITVQIAWYEKLWFRVLAACFLGLLVFVFMRIRLARSQYKNRMLEMHVSERTRRLEETLEFLQSSERQLHQQALMQQRLIAAITHDIKTPMKFLLLMTGAMRGKDKQHDALYETHYRMYHLIENLIQYMKMQFSVNGSSSEMLNLDQLLEEKAGIFRPIAQMRNVGIIHHTNGTGPALVNRQLLGVVVHNLLDNAVKYTPAGTITLETERIGDMVIIRVTDTGIGIHPQLLERVNMHSPGRYLAGDSHWPEEHRGLGLLIVIELLQLINGRLKMQPNEGGGTRVSVVLHLLS